jgi:hypothetical protein
MSIYDWLVNQGLYHDLVSACILVPILKVTSSRFAKRLAREIADAMRKGFELDQRVWSDMEAEIDKAKDDLDNVA